MQRSISSKVLSLLLASLLCLSVFAGIEIAIPRAYATEADVASPAVTQVTLNGWGGPMMGGEPRINVNAGFTQLTYQVSANGELFTNNECNWPLTTNNVKLTKTDGGAEIRPLSIYFDNYSLQLYFPANMAAGEYTVSFETVSDVEVTMFKSTVTILTRAEKPVINFGAVDANGEVTVTVSSDAEWLNWGINWSWYDGMDGNPASYQITATEPDPYPTKYIYAGANGMGLYNRNAVASYTFAPAADAFQVVVTPTKYSRETVDGESYLLIATLSHKNGSGEVAYELDSNYHDLVDGALKISGDKVYYGPFYDDDEEYEPDNYNYYENGKRPNYVDEEDYFDGDIPFIIATDENDAKAYANPFLPNQYDDEDEPVQPSRPSGGSSSGGGSSSSSRDTTPSVSAPSPVNQTTAVKNVKDAVTAAKNSPDGAAVKLKNVSTVSLSTMKEMAKVAGKTALKVHADSLKPDGTIDVRITIDPALATKEINLQASTTSAAAKVTQMKFEKHFDNTLSVVSLSQKGSFGMPVRIATKIDPKLDVASLVFYSYDSATNTFKKIENPEYKVDKNGFVHFTTSVGGEIIISDKPLTKK